MRRGESVRAQKAKDHRKLLTGTEAMAYLDRCSDALIVGAKQDSRNMSGQIY